MLGFLYVRANRSWPLLEGVSYKVGFQICNVRTIVVFQGSLNLPGSVNRVSLHLCKLSRLAGKLLPNTNSFVK